jgi:hypothetical protein
MDAAKWRAPQIQNSMSLNGARKVWFRQNRGVWELTDKRKAAANTIKANAG